MDTVIINVKTESGIKAQAKKIAADLGFSLSSLINAYLRQLIKSKTIYFSLVSEEPTEFLLKSLEESETDRKKGRVSPSFDNSKEAVSWLKNKKRKYAR